MAGQPEIQSYYREIHESVKVALSECYGKQIYVLDRATAINQYKSELVFIYRSVLFGKRMEFAVAVPWNFPTVFPDIFIHSSEDASLLGLPHIDIRHFICTYDKEDSSPNPTKPVEAIQKVIEKGTQIVRDGFYKVNNDSYLEEFTAYWGLDEIRGILYCDFTPSDKTQKLYLFSKGETNGFTGYVFKSKEKFDQFCDNIGNKKEQFTSRRILYIPFIGEGLNPRSKTISAMRKIIYGLKIGKLMYDINLIYHQKKRNNVFISSVVFEGQFILFAWEPVFQSIIKSKGFRKWKMPFFHAVFDYQKGNPIYKYHVERLDKQRIFSRVGIKLDGVSESKLLIAGNGSVGSHLAMSLSKSGFSNFTLVDNEKLVTGNIARHLCGFSHLDNWKVDGVSSVLRKHFPFVQVKAIHEDILEVLRDNPLSLLDSDLHIICIAKTNTELAIDRLLHGNLLFLWVEPFSLFCHGVYLPKESKIRFKDFFESGFRYKLQGIVNSEDYSKREAGCQSTFMPYSFTSFEMFIPLVTDQVRKILQNPNDLKAFTWIGELAECRHLNFQVNDRYKDRRMQFLTYEGHELEAITANVCNI